MTTECGSVERYAAGAVAVAKSTAVARRRLPDRRRRAPRPSRACRGGRRGVRAIGGNEAQKPALSRTRRALSLRFATSDPTDGSCGEDPHPIGVGSRSASGFAASGSSI